MSVKKTVEKKESIKEYLQKKRESIYYIGPTVKRGLLDNGSVFRGGLPKEVKDLKNKYPSLNPLFVSKEKYIESFNQIGEKGTKFYIFYENAKKETGGR